MIHPSEHKTKILSVITTFSKLTHMEIALFDESAKLVCATPAYKKIKGTSVHIPSINEVLEKGSVIVTTPGAMPSCSGCRFMANCPAKIEILASIHCDGCMPCVISITSFDKADEAILKNIKYYIQVLEILTQTIETLLGNLAAEAENDIIRQAYSTFLPENHLIIDTKGRILFNTMSEEFSDYRCTADGQLSFWVDEITADLLTTAKTNLTIQTRFMDEERILSSFSIHKGHTVIGQRIDVSHPTAEKKTLKSSLDQLIAVSAVMDQLKQTITRVARSSSSVVITGETGTGKELVAKSIHELSPRRNKPFAAVNCANFPEQLFESEFFGYEEGTFTGGKKGGKAGILELADGGTLFLDEVSELPLFQQAKLLRFIQERTITRLGGVIPIPINVRIICATNKDLQEEIGKGTFRTDLYYRLNVIKLRLPSLRQRKEDIPYIADYYLNLYKETINTSITSLTEESKRALENYDWPGNVRELENCIECALNIETGHQIQSKSLPQDVQKQANPVIISLLKENEANLIQHYLDTYGWHSEGKEKTAQTLDISMRSLYRKIKDYQLTSKGKETIKA